MRAHSFDILFADDGNVTLRGHGESILADANVCEWVFGAHAHEVTLPQPPMQSSGSRVAATITHYVAGDNLAIDVLDCLPELAMFFAQFGWQAIGNNVLFDRKLARPSRRDERGNTLLLKLASSYGPRAFAMIWNTLIECGLPMSRPEDR